MKDINAKVLKGMMDRGRAFVLLDVRGDEEFDEEHIPNALSAPLGHMGVSIECCVRKSAQIIVYSANRDCTASVEGVKRLVGMGFKDVLHFNDGIQGWKDAGLETIALQKQRKAA